MFILEKKKKERERERERKKKKKKEKPGGGHTRIPEKNIQHVIVIKHKGRSCK
jgi:hypothetical protein